MDTTPVLGLPLMMDGQGGSNTIYNQAMTILDTSTGGGGGGTPGGTPGQVQYRGSGTTFLGTAGLVVNGTHVTSITLQSPLAIAQGGTGASDAATARTNLGLVPGVNVQAYDAELAALAALTSAADRLPYFTGSGAAALAIFTSAGRALMDDADAAAQRTTLALKALAILDTVATPQIDNGAVTYAKLQNVSGTDRLLGRWSAGAGAVEEVTLGSGLTLDAAGVLSAIASGGVSTFLALTDTPDAYTGQAGKILSVKSDVSGLEFVPPPSGGAGGDGYWSRVDLGTSTLLDGLVAFWQLDEATGNRADSVSTHHLVPTGGLPNISSAAGKIGQALAMDGTAGTYLSVADNPALSAGANQSFTLAVWVYLAATGNMGIVGKGSVAVDSKNCEYMLWHYNGQYHFLVGDGTTFVNLASPFAVTQNQWTLLVAWYDATADTQNIQVNNGAVTSVANTAGSYDSGLPFEVGRTVGFTSQSLSGREDLLYFTKRVLTPSERDQLWNNGNGAAYPFAIPSRISPSTIQDQVLLAATPLTTERLEIDGGIKLGNSTGTVDGIVRWSGTNFEGRKGGAWVSLASPTLPLAIADGGTGATTAANARTALGLGTLAEQNANNVAIIDGRISLGGHAPTGVLDVQSSVMSEFANFYFGTRIWPVVASGALGVDGIRIEAPVGAGLTGAGFNAISIGNPPAMSTVNGLYSAVASGTGRYNIYAQGSAANYFAGAVGLGQPTPQSNIRLSINYQKGGIAGMALQPTDSDTGAFSAALFLNLAAATVGSITTTATATAFNTSSDVRLKHAIAPLTGSLDVIAALNPISHRWNADDSYAENFLAHELQRVLAYAVTGEPDAVNEDGSVRPQQVDASKIIPRLVGAVKELLARVETVEQALA